MQFNLKISMEFNILNLIELQIVNFNHVLRQL